MTKITKATFKSFAKKNKGKLYIKDRYHFDGRTDGTEDGDNTFTEANYSEWANNHANNTLGIGGVWLAHGGCDHFSAYKDDKFEGIEVYNACGCFTLAKRI